MGRWTSPDDAPESPRHENAETESPADSSLGRRRYLKLLGSTSAAAVLGASATGTAAAVETVTVGAGEKRTFDLGSGETLSNLLIDVSAPGADARISADGDGWEIRNVGVKGSFDSGRENGGFSNVITARGNGTIDTVYLGDGHDNSIRKGALGVPAGHAGHIDVVNAYIARWSGNAVYAAGCGRIRPPGKTDGGGGSLAFVDCYFRDNNIGHLRIASDGTRLENTVIHNTNSVPPHPSTAGGESGVVNSRGIYTGYGDPEQVITVENCDIAVTDENTNGAASAVVSGTHGTYGELTTVRVVDSEVAGAVVGGNVETENVGDNPDTSVPAGTPTDAQAAANGDGNADSANTGRGGDETTADESDGENSSDEENSRESHVLSISGGSASNIVEYSFAVGGTVEQSTANGASIDDEDSVEQDGSRGSGAVAGGTDSFDYTGELAALSVQGDTSGVTVTRDGTEIDPAEYPDSVADDGEDGTSDGGGDLSRTILVDGTGTEEVSQYEVIVTGSIERDEDLTTVEDGGLAWDRLRSHVEDQRAVGIVGNGVDAYRFSGELADIEIRGDASVELRS